MLAELAGGTKKVVTGEDGGMTIGMSADFAIVQGCADCHNNHPKTTKRKIGKRARRFHGRYCRQNEITLPLRVPRFIDSVDGLKAIHAIFLIF